MNLGTFLNKDEWCRNHLIERTPGGIRYCHTCNKFIQSGESHPPLDFPKRKKGKRKRTYEDRVEDYVRKGE